MRAAPELKLSQCDGKRIALVLPGQGVFQGVGYWSWDDILGGALRIPLEGHDDCASDAVLFLAESTWRGIATPDTRYGCDVCITLG
jgi:hypothetical protein